MDITAHNLGNGYNVTSVKVSDYTLIHVCAFINKDSDEAAGRMDLAFHKCYMDNGSFTTEVIAQHNEYNVLGSTLYLQNEFLGIRAWNGVGFALVFLYK